MTGPEVVVAVATFRRPDRLARLLPHLLSQAVELDPPAAVLIVDNDPGRSASPVVASVTVEGRAASVALAPITALMAP